MGSTEVYNWKKEKVGSAEVASDLLEAPVRKDIMHQVVRWQMANKRQGTHAAKARGEVRGGGAKPFRQKGTGNARQGSIRSPLMEGGAVIFGPKPRDYSFSMPKKVRQKGLKSAVSYLAQNNKLFVVDSMNSEDGKTKGVAEMLKAFGVSKALLVDAKRDDKFARAVRNIPKIHYVTAQGANVYDLLKFDCAIVTQEALNQLSQRCGAEK